MGSRGLIYTNGTHAVATAHAHAQARLYRVDGNFGSFHGVGSFDSSRRAESIDSPKILFSLKPGMLYLQYFDQRLFYLAYPLHIMFNESLVNFSKRKEKKKALKRESALGVL